MVVDLSTSVHLTTFSPCYLRPLALRHRLLYGKWGKMPVDRRDSARVARAHLHGTVEVPSLRSGGALARARMGIRMGTYRLLTHRKYRGVVLGMAPEDIRLLVLLQTGAATGPARTAVRTGWAIPGQVTILRMSRWWSVRALYNDTRMSDGEADWIMRHDMEVRRLAALLSEMKGGFEGLEVHREDPGPPSAREREVTASFNDRDGDAVEITSETLIDDLMAELAVGVRRCGCVSCQSRRRSM